MSYSSLQVEAPFFQDVAHGPKGNQAVFVRAEDAVRLRITHWPAAFTSSRAGTICLFPGRGEPVEKYGRMAHSLSEANFDIVAIDWRGQGLSDRLSIDPMAGHVGHFDDYQKDVAALLSFIKTQDLPRPLYMLAHSMGGAIGLRYLMDARLQSFKAAAFSAPMWGLRLSKNTEMLAHLLGQGAALIGKSDMNVPRTGKSCYLTDKSFEENELTSCPKMWDYMKQQMQAHPELAIGGPSFGWVDAALVECRALATRPSPTIPAYCAYGSDETVVSTQAIAARMDQWATGKTTLYDGARHEIMMEADPTQERFAQEVITFFQ